jgi:hypothetical protein
MSKETFSQGYLDGWESVAGRAAAPPLPEHVPVPPDGSAYEAGFRYGRSEALTRFKPGLEPKPID